MLTKLILLSDIHIRSKNDRTVEYQLIFNQLINKLKQIDDIKNSRIIILGDILDKVEFNSESVNLLFDLMERLTELTKVIIIAGNHDIRQYQKELNSCDMIARLMKKYNFYYFKDTGLYEDENITFGLVSTSDLQDNVDNLPKYPIGQNEFNIALIHSSVGFDYGVSFDYITKEGYKFLFAGDNHKYINKMNKDCLFISPSSTVQQTFGESILQHGFVVVDLINNKQEMIHLYNDYCFINIIYKNDNFYIKRVLEENDCYDLEEGLELINYPKYPRIKIKGNDKIIDKLNKILLSHDMTATFISSRDTIYNEFDDGYKDGYVKDDVNKDVDDKNINDDVNKDVDNKDDVNKKDINEEINIVDMMKVILKDNIKYIDKQDNFLIKQIDDILISDYQELYKDILKKDKDIINIINSIKKSDNNVNIKNNIHLNSLEWSYLYSYGNNNYINFDNMKNKKILINGHNAQGKSCIFDLIGLALFGKQTSLREDINCINTKIEDCVNIKKENDKQAFVKLIITINNKDVYEIRRVFHPHTEVKLKINGIYNTDKKKIEEYFSSITDLEITNMICQNDTNNFFSMKTEDQIKTLESSLNLGYKTDFYNLLKTSLTYHKSIHQSLKYILPSNTKYTNIMNEETKVLFNINKTFINNNKDQLKELENKIFINNFQPNEIKTIDEIEQELSLINYHDNIQVLEYKLSQLNYIDDGIVYDNINIEETKDYINEQDNIYLTHYNKNYEKLIKKISKLEYVKDIIIIDDNKIDDNKIDIIEYKKRLSYLLSIDSNINIDSNNNIDKRIEDLNNKKQETIILDKKIIDKYVNKVFSQYELNKDKVENVLSIIKYTSSIDNDFIINFEEDIKFVNSYNNVNIDKDEFDKLYKKVKYTKHIDLETLIELNKLKNEFKYYSTEITDYEQWYKKIQHVIDINLDEILIELENKELYEQLIKQLNYDINKWDDRIKYVVDIDLNEMILKLKKEIVNKETYDQLKKEELSLTKDIKLNEEEINKIEKEYIFNKDCYACNQQPFKIRLDKYKNELDNKYKCLTNVKYNLSLLNDKDNIDLYKQTILDKEFYNNTKDIVIKIKNIKLTNIKSINELKLIIKDKEFYNKTFDIMNSIKDKIKKLNNKTYNDVDINVIKNDKECYNRIYSHVNDFKILGNNYQDKYNLLVNKYNSINDYMKNIDLVNVNIEINKEEELINNIKVKQEIIDIKNKINMKERYDFHRYTDLNNKKKNIEYIISLLKDDINNSDDNIEIIEWIKERQELNKQIKYLEFHELKNKIDDLINYTYLTNYKKYIENNINIEQYNNIKVKYDEALFFNNKYIEDDINIIKLKEYNFYLIEKINELEEMDNKLINSSSYLLKEHVCKIIEQNMNQYLSSIDNIKFHIDYKDDMKRKGFVYSIENDVGIFKLRQASGYQKGLIKLLMRFVLAKFTKTKSNIKMFLMDECFKEFDVNNKNKIYKIINIIKDKYDNVVLVSHDEYIKSLCDKVIDIKIDKNNMSYIRCN